MNGQEIRREIVRIVAMARIEGIEATTELLQTLKPLGWTKKQLTDEIARARCELRDMREEREEQSGGLPRGFAERNGWICWAKSERHEEGVRIIYLKVVRNLTCLCVVRDYEGASWSRHYQIDTPDGMYTHYVTLSADFIERELPFVRGHLAHYGVEFSDEGGEYLRQLLRSWTPEAQGRVVKRLGWTDDTHRAYMLRDGSTVGSTSEVIVPYEISTSARYAPRGTLDEWKAQVAAKAVGNPLLMFMLCVPLAAPLLAPMGMDGVGFHFVGSSSSGKTSALMAAVSVSGPPDLKQTWRTTSNGIEGRAVASNDGTLFLDEMGQVAAKDAADIAYMLANGEGKQRADRSGGAREVLTWQVLFVSTGELGLADKVAEDRGRKVRAGQEVRLMDIPADDWAHGAFTDLNGTGNPAVFADRLRNAARQNHGHAMRGMIAHIAADPPAVVEKVKEAWPIGGQHVGQVGRVGSYMSLVAAAGEMAVEFGLVPWQPGDATKAAEEVFEKWLARRGGAMAGEELQAVRVTREFLSLHRESRFKRILPAVQSRETSDGQEKEAHVPMDAGPTIREFAGWYGEVTGIDGKHFWVTPDAFREMHSGANLKAVLDVLSKLGFLKHDPDRKTTKLPRGIDQNRPRVYQIDARILDADDAGTLS